MRILIIGNYLPDKQPSMQRFTGLLIEGLSSRNHELSVLRPKRICNMFGDQRTGLGKWLGYIDKYILFPITLCLRSQRFDLIHVADHSNAIYLPLLGSKPSITTCHDLLAVRAALGEFPEVGTGPPRKDVTKGNFIRTQTVGPHCL